MRLGEALEPQVVEFAVTAEALVSCDASSEALVVAEQAAWGEASASVADNALVSEQREPADQRVLYNHLDETFHASIQEERSRIERFAEGLVCAMTTSPSVDVVSLESLSVKEGEGLRPCHAGYRDSGNRLSK